MPRRSAVLTLPPSVKDWLDKALCEAGFAGYQLLADELRARGYDISKSSLHRYGQQFEERLAALKVASEQARAIVDTAPDHEGAMSEALMRLVQEKLFGVLQDIEVDPAKVNLASLAKSIAELGRASVTQKKFAEEVREQAQKEAEAKLNDSVSAVAQEAQREQLTPAQVLERVKAIYRGEA
jgi:hypothetical protein